MIAEGESDNFENFKDCLSTTVIQKLAPNSGKPVKKVKGRKNEIKPVAKIAPSTGDTENDAAELAEFIEYLAEEIFLSLPHELRTLSYAVIQDDSFLAEKYATPLESSLLEDLIKPLPLTIADSLVTYSLIAEPSDLDRFLEGPLNSYISSSSAPPPEHTPSLVASRPDGCEICQREQLPLTYHHLIPRAVHAKAVKRGWHKEWELNKVAWLCRACHSYVHRIASNETLGKELFSVELLMDRDDVQKWAQWVGRVRWKAR
ncbi:putative HNH nuclease [Septoria linicola]|nr:putative HNH nuclease [Septoria linicola]